MCVEDYWHGLHHGEKFIPKRRLELTGLHSGCYGTALHPSFNGQRISAQDFPIVPASEELVSAPQYAELSEHSPHFHCPTLQCDGSHAFLFFDLWDPRNELVIGEVALPLPLDGDSSRGVLGCYRR